MSMYEHYFTRKFSGSQYDQTQQLEQFLQGDLLDVIHARGGQNLKYKKMKEHLLEFYKKLKIGSKSYWRKQMQDATPNERESLDIYGMRLLELAELRFQMTKRSVLGTCVSTISAPSHLLLRLKFSSVRGS